MKDFKIATYQIDPSKYALNEEEAVKNAEERIICEIKKDLLLVDGMSFTETQAPNLFELVRMVDDFMNNEYDTGKPEEKLS